MDTMGIAALSMSMADTKLTRSVGVSMMKKAMEQVEQTGEQLIELMETVEVPEGLVDISV